MSETQEIFQKMKNKRLKHWQVITIMLVIYDVVAVCAAYFGALWLRFDCRFSMIPEYYLDAYMGFILIYAVICIVVFFVLRLYNAIWRFASYNELGRVMISSMITAVIHTVGITVFFRRMPISYYIFPNISL